MNYFKREALKLKNIREVKKSVNRAVKKLKTLGVNAIHCKRTFDSNQIMFNYVNEQFGFDVLESESYLVINRISEGKHTMPDTLYLYWKGDCKLMCEVLSSEGLNVVVPESDKKTILVNIDLFKE